MNNFNPNMTEIIEHRKHERDDTKYSSSKRKKDAVIGLRKLLADKEEERIKTDPFFHH